MSSLAATRSRRPDGATADGWRSPSSRSWCPSSSPTPTVWSIQQDPLLLRPGLDLAASARGRLAQRGLTVPRGWPRALALEPRRGSSSRSCRPSGRAGAGAALRESADLSDFRRWSATPPCSSWFSRPTGPSPPWGRARVPRLPDEPRGRARGRHAWSVGGEPDRGGHSLRMGHVDQGLTGQVQAAIDGLMLGLLYLGARRHLLSRSSPTAPRTASRSC